MLEKEVNYRKSITFEFARAEIAFDEYFSLVSELMRRQNLNVKVSEKIKLFDSYARWCGHVYECMLTLVKIEEQNAITEESKYPETDKEIQWEAEKSIRRYSALDREGTITPVLNEDFAESLRIVRNKCSFHCTHSRVKTSFLKNFHEKHHHMTYWLFKEFSSMHIDMLNTDNLDLGEINNFYEIFNN